jgi:DNA repair ATPase RecN
VNVRILDLETTAGFLKDAKIQFDAGLTCIIGARGTCKSTIVETLRFIFDCDRNRVKALIAKDGDDTDPSAPHQGIICATLGTGGVAKCSVRRIDSADELVTIEREIGSESKIYQDGIQELADLSLLHCVEIYSQGDLQAIAQVEKKRLELIDRPNKQTITELESERKVLAFELKALGLAIRLKWAEIEARTADVKALEALRPQLIQLQSERPVISSELDAERDSFLRRKTLLEQTAHALAARKDVLSSLLNVLGTARQADAPPAAISEIESDSAELIQTEFARFQAFTQEIAAEASRDVEDELQSALTILKDECDLQNARYFALRQEQQDVNECLKREDSLKQQIAHFEKIRAELERFSAELEELKRKRSACRAQMRNIADRIFSLRYEQVEIINELHGEVIVLSIEQGIISDEYADQLEQLLQGSRLRAQDDVAKELAERVKPHDLIDIVEASDVPRLTKLLNRDVGQMTRLVAFLADRQELYELEGIHFEDRLEITLYHQNVSKPVHQLSKGQMATALLPLILRPAPYPLIFDQPEDDLDNSFIYETFVQQIHKLKRNRQLIFVTHNANIPVLGEADRVVVMDMKDPKSAREPLVGSVDDVKQAILSLLEGGAEAFNRRRKKYDPLLSDPLVMHGALSDDEN